MSTSTGNLLSNVAPPSALPSFVSNFGTMLSERPNLDAPIQKQQEPEPSKSALNAVVPAKSLQQETRQITETGINTTPSIQNVQTTVPTETIVHDLGMVGGGLLSWVKETVVNSSVLSKVAEKAKNSVNTIVTTLDPQMREFICK